MLVARSPLHIGSGRDDVALDLPATTDGHGRPVIPGTSLAGVLRHSLGEADGSSDEGAPAVAMWGSEKAASRLLVDDASLADSSRDVREVLSTTAIHKKYGVALAEALVAREVVAAGSRFDLRIVIESGDPTPQHAVDRANMVVAQLMSGVTLGAAGTRGLGRVQLDANLGLRIEVFGDLGTKQGVLASLDGNGDLKGRPKAATRVVDGLEVTVDWSPAATLMCGVASIGEVDVLPRTTTRVVRNKNSKRPQPRAHLVLPGSSIKGALRARARLIAAATETPTAVAVLFGDDARRGALEFDDVYTTDSVAATVWETTVHDRPKEDGAAERREKYRKGLGQADPLQTDVVDRVAIDRWTGGAADGQLFTALEPRREIAWQPMRMRFDAARVPAEAQRSAIALLFLVLRDLGAGRIPFGRGTRRGWGAVDVSSIEVAKQGDMPVLIGVANLLAPTASERDALGQLMKGAFTQSNTDAAATPEELQ